MFANWLTLYARAGIFSVLLVGLDPKQLFSYSVGALYTSTTVICTLHLVH